MISPEEFILAGETNNAWSFRDMTRIGRRDWTPRQNPRNVTATTSSNPLDDELRANCSSGPITVTLETAVACDGRRHVYKKIDSTTNTLTIAFTSTETCDGVSTIVLSQQYAVAKLISNGTNWDLETPQFGSFTSTAISGLTAKRVPYVSTAGLLVDSANLTFDGTTLAFTSTNALFGTSTALTIGGTVMPQVQVHGIDAATARLSIARWSANNAAANLFSAKSRGASIGTHAIVQNSDAIFSLISLGSDGTAFQQAAAITFRVDATGTVSTNSMPGQIAFFTTPNGVTVLSTALIIDSQQNALFSGHVSSQASVTAYNATGIPAGGTAGAGYKFFSTANFGVFGGSGLPTLTAAQGSLYTRSDGTTSSSRLYVNTGTTNWTAVLTAT